jgi:SHS2 domain-containing protein
MRNYETFATTADTGIRFKARDFRGLYENALKGLNLLLFGPRSGSAPGCGSARFRFEGAGPESVLVNFLSEVLFLAYQKNKRVTAIAVTHAGESSLAAWLKLAPCLTVPKIEIKAVTYHNLRVVEEGGMKSASIVFDI